MFVSQHIPSSDCKAVDSQEYDQFKKRVQAMEESIHAESRLFADNSR